MSAESMYRGTRHHPGSIGGYAMKSKGESQLSIKREREKKILSHLFKNYFKPLNGDPTSIEGVVLV